MRWSFGAFDRTYPVGVTRRLTSAGQARRVEDTVVTDVVIADDVDRILAVLESAVVVVGPDGTVLRSNDRALALGVVNRGRIAIADIAGLADDVLETTESAEREFRVRRPPLGRELMDLRVRVAALDNGCAVVLINDLGDDRRADVVRRDFVANVSHELKTPVGALSLLAEAILSSADDATQTRIFAERMRIESDRLAHLIQDIIDLSRLQADDPLTRAELVDVDDLVMRTVDEVRTLADSSQVELVEGAPCGAAVLGERTQLQTALRNLLVNAVSYSPPATKVAVEARTVGSLVEIMVKDQGIGIPASELDRIFERFYRVDPARSRATGGTGLGLSIVKHVCQNHGGEVRVWSETGVGSTFVLRLPVYAGDGPVGQDAHISLVEELPS